MYILKRTFGFVWALWAAFWFMVVVIIFTPLYALLFVFTGKRYVMQCVWINCHYLSPFLLAVSLIRVKVFGREGLSAQQNYVYVANHLSQVDIIASAATVPHPIRFLAKIETNLIPVFGFMVQMLALQVNRKDKDSREKSVFLLLHELEMGRSVFLYPEGTRNRTAQPLKEFKDGAFKVAIMSQTPIVVQTLVGTKEVNNPNGIQLYPGKVKVYFSRPIYTAGMTMDDLETLKARVRSEMMSHLS